MKIKLNKKYSIGFIILGLIVSISSISFGSSNINELKSVEKQLESEKIKLKEVKKKESSALNKLYNVNRMLKNAKNDLSGTQIKISSNRNKIIALESEINQTETELKNKGNNLSNRISEAYKSGGTISFFELLFASKSIADFINREYYFEKLIESDAALLSEIKEKVASAEEAKRKLSASINEMKGLEKDLSKKKRIIEGQVKEKEEIYNNLSARRKEYEKRVEELAGRSEQLESLINKTVKSPTSVVPKSTGKMEWPIKGRFVSGFGYRRHPIWGGSNFHTGIDIASPYGNPIKAADGGKVIFSGWWGGYGKAVVIDHGKGTTTVYGHMSRIYVKSGQYLGKGQIVGLIGSTGFSTGPHLHFEVRRGGKPVNPMGYL